MLFRSRFLLSSFDGLRLLNRLGVGGVREESIDASEQSDSEVGGD